MPQLLGCHSPRFEQCKPGEWQISHWESLRWVLSNGKFWDFLYRNPRKVRKNRRNAPNIRSILHVFLERNITNAFLNRIQTAGWHIKCTYSRTQQTKQAGHAKVILVGSFNPFEKYLSNLIISPGKGENKTYLKPPTSSLIGWFCLMSNCFIVNWF